MKQKDLFLYLSIGVLILGVAMLIAGSVMLGIGVHKSKQKSSCPAVTPEPPPKVTTTSTSFDRQTIRKMIQDGIRPENIKQNLKNLTIKPHQAGTDNNKNVAAAIQDMWQSAGLEDVHLIEYTVLLTYPDFNNPNRVTIAKSTGELVYQTNGTSPVYFPAEQGDSGAGIQWLAYSPPGKITGDVVYCHLGSTGDFQTLKDKGINLTGKIALIRYGGPFRGDKVRLAQENGAIGVILFSDPAEVATDGTDPSVTYPNTIYMPPEGVQRGTVYTGDGDPLSPLYPSKPNLWRELTMDEAVIKGDIPNIPCLPISYTAARQILERMNGPVADKWNGALNVTYRYGPGLIDGMTTTIEVHSHFENRTIQNVIGYIYGIEEPDKYIILGNHYDAWVYGAMDPNAGTAALAEVARSMAQTVQQTGWRPARTIMFANWDAEEYGLIGSTEFAEDYSSILMQRAVVYLNMDCYKGNLTLYVQASPSLNQVTVDAAKNVPNPNEDEIKEGRPTVFDTWLNNFPRAPGEDTTTPYISTPNGGSDHKTFLTYLGIPVVNFYFLQTNNSFTYPLYHTLYETPFAIENLMDTNNYSTHRAIGQYWAEMALSFADTPTIPFRLAYLTHEIVEEYIPSLRKAIETKNMPDYTADGMKQLDNMAATANLLDYQSNQFDNQTFAFTFADNIIDRIRWNDRINNFQNCFVNPRGAPGDPTARHVLYSVSKTDAYAGQVMQQVYAVLDQMSPTMGVTELQQFSRDLADQISIVHYSLQCAEHSIDRFI